LAGLLDVGFVKTWTDQRFSNIESRSTAELASRAFDSFEMDYGRYAFFQANSSGGITRIDES
jgi:hypothetical protein